MKAHKEGKQPFPFADFITSVLSNDLLQQQPALLRARGVACLDAFSQCIPPELQSQAFAAACSCLSQAENNTMPVRLLGCRAVGSLLQVMKGKGLEDTTGHLRLIVSQSAILIEELRGDGLTLVFQTLESVMSIDETTMSTLLAGTSVFCSMRLLHI